MPPKKLEIMTNDRFVIMLHRTWQTKGSSLTERQEDCAID